MPKRAIALILVGALLMFAQTAQSAAEAHTKVSLSGPRTGIKLYTPYTYTVKIVAGRDLRNATVALKWTGCLGVSKKIRLLRRGRAWTWSYALTYEVERAGEGVTVDLLSQNHELIGAQTLTVQLEPPLQPEHGFKCKSLIGS